MKITLKNMLTVRKPSSTIMKDLQLTFKVKNPAYIEATKQGRWIGDTPEYLKFYEKNGNTIKVPRGYASAFCARYQVHPEEIKDKTIAPEIDIKLTTKPRPYQKNAIKDLKQKRYGILEAPTGSGKSFTGIAMIAKWGVKTLIVVHSKELQDQWYEALLQFTNIDATRIGFIGGGKPMKVRDVTIGIVNSVTKNVEKIENEIGFLITDETHRVLGTSWINIINGLKPRYQLGLTATPYRKDKLEHIMFKLIGDIVHTVPRAALEATGNILVPRVIVVPTMFSVNDGSDYQHIMRKLTKDIARTELIADTTAKDIKQYSEPILIVSDRVSHCEMIYESLVNRHSDGIKPVLLTGKTKKIDRENALIGFKNKRYNILIATLQLIGEGFDVPIINAIFLTTPVRWKGRLIQSIGRIIRPSDGLRPRVYDFRDNNVGMLRNSGFARNRVYKQHGWLI